jgi:hypothetical protein
MPEPVLGVDRHAEMVLAMLPTGGTEIGVVVVHGVTLSFDNFHERIGSNDFVSVHDPLQN